MKGWNVGLWVLQGLLGVMFAMAGAAKMMQPMDALQGMGMTFVTYTPEAVVRFIGVSELAGGLGLVLPSALRIQPILTPVASGALAFVMALAAGAHATHGEGASVLVNVVLGTLLAFVAWGRSTKAPIAPR